MPRASTGTTTNLGGSSVTIGTVNQGNPPWTFDLVRVGGTSFSLGQQLAASSLPVVLTAAQISTLTPLSTVTVNQGTSPWVVSLTSTTITGTVAVTQSGTWNLNNISGTISLPTGASTLAEQQTQTTHLATLAGTVVGTEVQVDVLTMPTVTVTATNLDIRDLTSASDSVLIYGSDDGGTTKRVIKTDSGGALQVDLEVASVTVTNGAGASAVNIQDGGNTITVDGTVAFSNTTIAVTNAGTFAVQAAQSGTWNITDISGTVSLPTGASTLAEQQTQTTALGTLLTSANFAAAFGTAGTADAQVMSIQGIASMTPVQISDGGNIITVDGTVTANAGTNLNTSLLALESGGNLATIAGKDFATQTTLAAINAKLVSGTDIGDVTINNAAGAAAVNIQDGGNTITVDGTVTATPTGTYNTKPTPSTTATLSNVAGSASSVTVLALNTARLGATIVNDSTSRVYLKFGSSASTTSYSYTLFQYETLEVPFGYTGIITGIWDSATGSARVTELTA